MRKKRNMENWTAYIMIFLILMSCATKSLDSVEVLNANIYEDVPFKMEKVKEPVIPGYEVSILDFGAIGDGLFDNTEVFALAIDHISEKGGGRIVIPKGIWLTGPIVLKSKINLHTEHGALVLFSLDFDKYPLIETSFEGLDTYRCLSPIYGKGLNDIAITGQGVFDGAGDGWRPVKKNKLTEDQWQTKVNSGGVLSNNGSIWYPSESSKKGDTAGNFNVPDLDGIDEFMEVKDFMRPVLLSLISCERVLLDGPTFQNSPAWNLHPLMCKDVILRNLKIRNPWYSQNGDGLDLESCKSVLIYNNTFDVGDDAICFKSGKNEDGLKRNIPNENVIVKYNVVYHGHGGFVIGSEMSGGMNNILVANCTFIGTDCGLRFKSTRGRGGVVENIYIRDIDMIDIPTEPIRFNLFYGGESPLSGSKVKISEKVEVSRTTPAFRNIYMKNISSTGSSKAAFFQGLPEMKLENIQLENVKLEAKSGMIIIDSDKFVFKNVEIIIEKGTGVTAYNLSNTIFDGLNLDVGGGTKMKFFGDESNNLSVNNSNVKPEEIEEAEEIQKGTIKIN